jgi:hypothetical protein
VVFGTVLCIGVISGSSVIGIVVSKPSVVGAAVVVGSAVVEGSVVVALSSHVCPVYCSKHVHVNVIPSSLFEHVPECLHGDVSQGFELSVVSGVVVGMGRCCLTGFDVAGATVVTCVLHVGPVYSGGQVHLNDEPSSESLQVPELKHGDDLHGLGGAVVSGTGVVTGSLQFGPVYSAGQLHV